MSTVQLGPLDAAIVALFFAAILALGFSAKLRENTSLQFIAAGRALTLPTFVATLVATWYGGILGIGESVQYYGVGTWLLFGVPYYVFALVYALVLARRVREAEQISIPERIGARWGRSASLVAAGLLFLLGVPAAHVLMLGTLAQSLTGWGLALSVIVATLASSLFLYKGGLLADVRVSLLSFTMMYVGFAVIVAYCLVAFPLGDTMKSFAGTNTLKLDGGVGPLGVVSFMVLGAWTLIDPGFHQRVASARDPETGRKGVLVAIVCWVVFDLLSVTAGLYALALMKSPPQNPLLIFPLFGDQVLPQGLKALFLCGILGTVLTAMVGYSLVSGATLGRDILAQALRVDDERKKANLARLGIAASCLVAVPVSLSFNSVVLIWYLWAGAIIGALLLPTLASYVWRDSGRLSPSVVTASMLIGFIISVSWLIYGSQTGQGQVVRFAGGTEIDVGTLLPGALASGTVLAIGALTQKRSKR